MTSKRWRIGSRQIRVADPQAIAQVLSLATVLDPDGRLAALPGDRQDRLLADKLELIAASPQQELLRSFWNAEAGQTRILIRLKEQHAGPRQVADLSRGHGRRRREVRPHFLLDRPLVPDDPDDRGDHRHPVGDVPLVGGRHPADADPGVPQLGPRVSGHHADAACRSPWCWA